MIEGIFLDLDGTMYRGGSAVPGAAQFVRGLRALEIGYLFVTNRASRPPSEVVAQLRGMGIPCEEEDVLTSAQATASWLEPGTAYAIGGDGPIQALSEKGFTLTDENPRYVVVGLDARIDYAGIEKAARLVMAGAKLIGTNPDRALHSDTGVSPGNGAIVTAIAMTAGVEPVYVGKPERPIFEIGLRRLGLQPGETLVVGDNLDTDILGGRKAGMQTALILTGISSREDLTRSAAQPTWVVDNFDELTGLIHKNRI